MTFPLLFAIFFIEEVIEKSFSDLTSSFVNNTLGRFSSSKNASDPVVLISHENQGRFISAV